MSAGYSFGAASAAFSATAAAQVCRSATSRAASSRSLGCLLPQPTSSAVVTLGGSAQLTSGADSDDQEGLLTVTTKKPTSDSRHSDDQ